MGEAIVPAYTRINPKVVGDHVKSKLDALVSTYRKFAERLRKTGDGVKDPNFSDVGKC